MPDRCFVYASFILMLRWINGYGGVSQGRHALHVPRAGFDMCSPVKYDVAWILHECRGDRPRSPLHNKRRLTYKTAVGHGSPTLRLIFLIFYLFYCVQLVYCFLHGCFNSRCIFVVPCHKFIFALR
jgi:hypothetical protein